MTTLQSIKFEMRTKSSKGRLKLSAQELNQLLWQKRLEKESKIKDGSHDGI